MLLLNYRAKIWKEITQDNKSKAGWTENNKDKKIKGIDNADKKKLVRTIFLSGQFFVRTKGHLPPSRISPKNL